MFVVRIVYIRYYTGEQSINPNGHKSAECSAISELSRLERGERAFRIPRVALAFLANVSAFPRSLWLPPPSPARPLDYGARLVASFAGSHSLESISPPPPPHSLDSRGLRLMQRMLHLSLPSSVTHGMSGVSRDAWRGRQDQTTANLLMTAANSKYSLLRGSARKRGKASDKLATRTYLFISSEAEGKPRRCIVGASSVN